MKHAKKFFALLLCAALLAGLTVPAFADTPEFAITADKKMAASGETITLTAVNAPQAGAGQWLEYAWMCYDGSLIITTEPTLQVQIPGTDKISMTERMDLKIRLPYSCNVHLYDASGFIQNLAYATFEVQGYFNFADSLAAPYRALGDGYFIWAALTPFSLYTFLYIACIFGIVWSPFVWLANVIEAKLVNG